MYINTHTYVCYTSHDCSIQVVAYRCTHLAWHIWTYVESWYLVYTIRCTASAWKLHCWCKYTTQTAQNTLFLHLFLYTRYIKSTVLPWVSRCVHTYAAGIQSDTLPVYCLALRQDAEFLDCVDIAEHGPHQSYIWWLSSHQAEILIYKILNQYLPTYGCYRAAMLINC